MNTVVMVLMFLTILLILAKFVLSRVFPSTESDNHSRNDSDVDNDECLEVIMTFAKSDAI